MLRSPVRRAPLARPGRPPFRVRPARSARSHTRAPRAGLASFRWGILLAVLAALALPLPGVGMVGVRTSPLARAEGAPVALTPSLPSGQPVGTPITWTATVTGTAGDVYRFSVGPAGGPLHVVRDFSLTPSFTWTPMEEGDYEVEVAAKAGFTATDSLVANAAFAVASRVTGAAVVSATANPLVALYSAPACDVGEMVAQFRPVGASDDAWVSTLAQPCQAGQSRNFLVAGMLPATTYLIRSVVAMPTGPITSSTSAFTTGTLPADLQFPAFTVPLAATAQSDQSTPVLLHLLGPSAYKTMPNPVATDLSGRVDWYYDTLRSDLSVVWPVNMVPGGTVLLFGRDAYRTVGDDVLREIDLAGDPVRETNIDAINAQLATHGQGPIYSLHHDALRLPNGDIAVLGMLQRTISGVGSHDDDVEGDLLIVLDADLQVAWTWNPFDHMDPVALPPIDGGTCADSDGGVGLCAIPDPQSEDWLHTNSIAWSPSDNDIVLSFRHLDWVVKINYSDGSGNGDIVWRLGKNGDFTITDPDPMDTYPWFSHQHNAYYVDSSTMVLFDDGNTRCAGAPSPCDSRGQAISLDEAHRSATLLLNADLGNYSLALGSAQRLPNGDYSFGSGAESPGFTGRSIEVNPAGTPVYIQHVNVGEYRAFREGSLDQGTDPVRDVCATPTPCSSPSSTPTATPSPTATDTATPTATATATPTETPSSTATPTDTATATPASTATPVPAATATPTGVPAMATDTPSPTATPTPSATAQPTAISQPTVAPAPPSATPVPPTATLVPPTATVVPPAPTDTATATPTMTSVPAATATRAPTLGAGPVTGATLRMAGAGFLPGETVRLTLAGRPGQPAVVTTATADAQGRIAVASLALPCGVTAGLHSLSAVGATSGRATTITVRVLLRVPRLVLDSAVSSGAVTVRGTGFGCREGVTLALDGVAVATSPARITTADGRFVATVPVSALRNTASGSTGTLSAVGAQSGAVAVAALAGQAGHPDDGKTRYVAGIPHGAGMQSALDVFNPTARVAHVQLTLYTSAGTVATRTVAVGGHRAATVPLPWGRRRQPAGPLGLVVQASQTVATQVTIARDGKDGDTLAGVAAPNTTWSFAEGRTGHSFHETLALLNPDGKDAARVRLQLLTDDGQAGRSLVVSVPAHGQRVVDLDRVLPGPDHTFGVVATADRPIVAERTLSFGVGGAGLSTSMGAAHAAGSWLFAPETAPTVPAASGTTAPASAGASGTGGEETYLLVLNPSGQAATVTARFLGARGQLLGQRTLRVAGQSRATLRVPAALEDGAVQVSGGRPVVVERAVYAGDPGGRGAAGVDEVGRNGAVARWAFPGAGAQGHGSTVLQLYNPTGMAAQVTVTGYDAGGRATRRRVSVPAGGSAAVAGGGLARGGSSFGGITLATPAGQGLVASQ